MELAKQIPISSTRTNTSGPDDWHLQYDSAGRPNILDGASWSARKMAMSTGGSEVWWCPAITKFDSTRWPSTDGPHRHAHLLHLSGAISGIQQGRLVLFGYFAQQWMNDDRVGLAL